MKYILFILLLVGTALLWAGGAMGAEPRQQQGMSMSGDHMTGHGMPGTHGRSAMNLEYMRAMNDMHGPMMDGVMDPDPDAAFVRGMLPHHKGAVAMAEIQLKYGKDPDLRKLAQEIIDAQQKEMTMMQDWMNKHHRPQ